MIPICPALSLPAVRKDFNDLLKRLDGKPVEAGDIKERDGYLASLSPEEQKAYFRAHALWSQHGADSEKIGAYLDAFDGAMKKLKFVPQQKTQTKTKPPLEASAATGTASGPMLSDVGEKIGGARKDRWKERGLALSDLEGMTGGEESRYVSKANIWKPDYADMIARGTTPEAAAAIKLIYDQIASKPRSDTPEGRRRYLTTMTHAKETLSAVKTLENARAIAVKIRERIGWAANWKDEETRALLFSVYKGRTDPFHLGYEAARRVARMVSEGFPNIEPWQRRFDVKESTDGFAVTPRGKYRAVDDERFVSKEQAIAHAKVAYETSKAAAAAGELPSRPYLEEIKRTGRDIRAGRNMTGEDFLKDFGFRGIEFGNWAASDERQGLVNYAYEALHDLADTLEIPPTALSLDGQLGLAFGARGGGWASAHYEPSKLVINLTKLRGAGSLAHEWAHALDHYLGELDRPDAYKGAGRYLSGGRGAPSMTQGPKTALRPALARAFDGVMQAMFKRKIDKAEAVRAQELAIEKSEALIARQRAEIERVKDNEGPEYRRFIKQSSDWVAEREQVLAIQKQKLVGLREEPEPDAGYGSVGSSYSQEASKLSGKSSEGYWQRPTEMFARAFESYVFDRLKTEGIQSDYLVHGVEPERYADETYKGNPYPAGTERDAINAAIGKLVSTLEVKETGRGTALGAIDPELLGAPQAAKAIHEVADTIRSAHDDFRRAFNPAARGGTARPTSLMVRQRAAEQQRSLDQVEETTKKLRKAFASMPEEDRWKFIDDEERRQPQATADLDVAANLFRDVMDDDRNQVRSLGTGKLQQFNETYMPRYWEKTRRQTPSTLSGRARAPLEGAKAFTKKRSYEFFMDGLNAGETPLSDNPVDFLLWKHAEMQKYIKAHENLNELKDNGVAIFARTQGAAPAGWETPKDNLFAVWGRSRQGELVMRGHYYLPEEAVKIFDNYISKGLSDKQWFRAYRSASNLINQFQLGLSFFHGGFVSLDAVISNNALAIYQAGHRDIGKAALTAMKSPLAPFFYLREGRRMRQEWLVPGTHPELAPIVDAWVAGGGRSKMDDFYRTHISRKAMDAFRSGTLPGFLGGVLRLPFAAVEQAARPMMEWMVPNMKAGAVAKMAEYELQRLGPNATQDEIRDAMAKVVDSADNRMGQMIYDNLFFNKMAKDLGMATVRSLGWNLGDLREFGGGAVDTATQVGRIGGAGVRGGARLLGAGQPPIEMGEEPSGVWSMKNPEVTHRMAYLIALPVTVGILGGILTWLMTGNKPTELRDYYYPKTGNLDENGDPERVSLPSYMKDIMPVFLARGLKNKAKTLSTMAVNKLHPMIGMIWQMLSNKDYYGTEIRNEDDPLIQQAKDIAKYIAKDIEPFGLRNIQKERERGASWKKSLLPEIGITPAPKTINQTAAQQLIAEIQERQRPKGTRTKAEAEKYKLEAEISRGLRKGDQAAETKLVDAVKSGVLSRQQAKILSDHATAPRGLAGFKQLGIGDALDVWDAATPQERERWRPALSDKAPMLETLPESQRETIENRFDKALGGTEDTGAVERLKKFRESDSYKTLDPGERREVLLDTVRRLRQRPDETQPETDLHLRVKAEEVSARDALEQRPDFASLTKDQKRTAHYLVSLSFSHYQLSTSQRKLPEAQRSELIQMKQRTLEEALKTGLIERTIEQSLLRAKRKAA